MADITPPAFEQEAEILGYISEALEEGDAFLRSQRGFSKISESISMIMGDAQELRSPSLSSTTSNHFGKVAADLSALLTDVKPMWEYRTYNRRYEPTQVNLGKLSTAWFTSQHIDMRFVECVKYATVGGTSYSHIFWDEEIDDLNMMAEDPRDVIPIRPAGNESIQSAYGVIIRREFPVNYLRRRYPGKAAYIKADRDGSYKTGLDNTRFGRLMEQMTSPFRMRLFGKDPAKEMPRIPTADCYTLYLKDRSRNLKPYPVQVGDFDKDGKALNNWSYVVDPGDLLYPRGRMIVATRTAVLRDGPNIYWHGKFPCPKLTLDPWPWTWLGKAPLWDLISLQKALDRLLRVIDDHVEQVARPGVIADKNSTSKAMLDKLDTRRAGWKVQQNPLAGKGIQVVYPNPLPSDIFGHRDWLTNEMDLLSGASDMRNLMKLNQLPSADSMEKLMESMTATVRARSRVIEAFMREFAEITAYNFAQFYTLPRRVQILGPDGLTAEDFDYDPGTLIPDFVHESDFDRFGHPTADALERGPLPRYERAREFMRQFTFHVSPGSLLAASQIEQKLMYLNLARAGLIDFWTLMDQLGIPNVGNPPANANTIADRLVQQQQMGIGMNGSAAGRKQAGDTMPRMVTKTS